MSIKKPISTSDQYNFFSKNNTKIQMNTAISTLKNSILTTISSFDYNEIPYSDRLSNKTKDILRNELYNELLSPSKERKTIKKSEIFKKALYSTERHRNISSLKPKLTKDKGGLYKKPDYAICELCNFNEEEEEKEKEKERNIKINKYYSGIKNRTKNQLISFNSKEIDTPIQKKESILLKNRDNENIDKNKIRLLTLNTLSSIGIVNKNNEYNKTLSISRNIKQFPNTEESKNNNISYSQNILKPNKSSIKNKNNMTYIVNKEKSKNISPTPSSLPILETNTKLNNFLFKNFTFEKDMTRIYNIVSIKDNSNIGKSSKKGFISYTKSTKSNIKKNVFIGKKDERQVEYEEKEKRQKLKGKINYIIDSIEADRTVLFDKDYKSLYEYEERSGLDYYNKDCLKKVMNMKKYFNKLKEKNDIFDNDFDFDLIKKKKNEIYKLEEDSYGIKRLIPKYMKKRFKIQTNLKYNYYNGVMFGNTVGDK